VTANPRLPGVILDLRGPHGGHGHEVFYEGFTVQNLGARPLTNFVATFDLDDAVIRVRKPAQWNAHGLGKATIRVTDRGHRLELRVTTLRPKSYLLVRTTTVLGGERGLKCDSATLSFPGTSRRYEYRYPCYTQYGA
jgi:hypothetical protein